MMDLFSSRFGVALTYVDVAPCDGCRHWQRCATEQLACSSFVRFYRYGYADLKPGVPMRHFYVSVFGGVPDKALSTIVDDDLT